MTKKRARQLLDKYFEHQSKYSKIEFPITDVVIYTFQRKGIVSSWSFKGLIKIAYDL